MVTSLPTPTFLSANVAVADVVDSVTLSPDTTPESEAEPMTSWSVAAFVASYVRLLAVMPVTVKALAVTVMVTVVVSESYETLVGTKVTDNV